MSKFGCAALQGCHAAPRMIAIRSGMRAAARQNGRRFSGSFGSAFVLWVLTQSIVTAKAENIAMTPATTQIASVGISISPFKLRRA
jgi:hypothetical protein